MFQTKQDFAECLITLCENVSPYFTADKSRLVLGPTAALYDDSTIGLEGFARLLW